MPTEKPSSLRPKHFFINIFLVLVVLHTYIGWQLLPSLAFTTPQLVIGIVYLCLSSIFIPLGMAARFLISQQSIADFIAWVGAILMGFFSSLLVLTLLRELLLPWVTQGTQQNLTFSAWGVLIMAGIVTLVGFMNARGLPRTVEIEVPIEGLPLALHSFRIVQISDLHVGPTIKGPYVSGVVDRVNGLHPDLIAVTGDVVDGQVAQLAADTAELGRMRARHGVYVVAGNHEYYSGVASWMAEFRRLGLRTLMNQHEVITHDGAVLIVAGVTDFNAHQFDVLQQSDPTLALAGAPPGVKLLLAHQPRSAPMAAAAGFDLQLSGHTHGGQFWPWNLFVSLQQPFTAGLHRMGKLWVYTSRGTGYWGPPKRFGAPSEITLIRLVCAKKPEPS